MPSSGEFVYCVQFLSVSFCSKEIPRIYHTIMDIPQNETSGRGLADIPEKRR